MDDAPHNKAADDKLARLIARAVAAGPALPCVVVHPVDASSLAGAMEAAAAGLIIPILVGPAAKIHAAAAAGGIDLTGATIEDAPHSQPPPSGPWRWSAKAAPVPC